MPNVWTYAGKSATDEKDDVYYKGTLAAQVWYKGEIIWLKKIVLKGASIVLMLDNSSSMGGEVANLIRNAKEFCSFVASISPNTLLSVGYFGVPGQARQAKCTALKPAAEALDEYKDYIDTVIDARSNTPTGLAIEVAGSRLAASGTGAKIIVVFSDGMPYTYYTNEVEKTYEAANKAKNRGMIIITLCYSSNTSCVSLMRNIATNSNLSFVGSESIDDLFTYLKQSFSA